MALAEKASYNETDPESKEIIKTLKPKSPVTRKQTTENNEPLMMKTPKFEICISPVEEGRKFEIEFITNELSQKKKQKKPCMMARQVLKDVNCNDVSPAAKKKSKSRATPKKRLPEKCSSGFVDEESQENRLFNETLNITNNINVTKNETKIKEKALPSRKKKTVEGRVSLPEMKRKSLKLTSPSQKKPRHTLETIGNLNHTKKESRMSNTEKVKKMTRRGRTKSTTPTTQDGDAVNVRGIENLKREFPDVDPTFLLSQLCENKNNLENLIESLKEKQKSGELPVNESYKKKLECEKIVKKFMQNFSIKNFLKAIPDPWNYFLNTEIHNSVRYANHSLHYLKNKHKKHYSQTIQEILARCDYSLYKADKELSNKRKNRMLKMRTTNRSKNECDSGKPASINFQFLQEVVFIENENEIIEEVKRIESAKSKKLKKAKLAGSLLRCQSCFRSDLLWEEAACCSSTHVFCGKCINRYIETEMGKGNFDFKCLLKCKEVLPLESIQDVVNPDLMAVIVRRNQIKEMRLAGIENIEFCPSCYQIFETNSEQQSLLCLNPCCGKEFCRYCKKTNHAPLDCFEADNLKMSESMLEANTDCKFIICQNCQCEFIKDGSNKMICSCGVAICSICRQPFSDCPHFITKSDEENSLTNDELSYKSSQEEPDSPKQDNFEAPEYLPSCNDLPQFIPDFVSSDSGTF